MKLFTKIIILLLLCRSASAVDITEFADPTTRDWGPAIQKAFDSLIDTDERWPDTSGGVIHFPKGRYLVLTPIITSCPGIIMTGEGTHYSYACTIEWKGSGALFTLMSGTK